MFKVLTADVMSSADHFTIEKGIPSLVLMERAALSVLRVIEENELDLSKVLIVCGTGNNAADGAALARLIAEQGEQPTLWLTGNPDKYSPEMQLQLAVLREYPVDYADNPDPENYSLVIDALFGTGLRRDITGKTAEIIDRINLGTAPVIAVDIPSGLSADTGHILGTAVAADITVTFQYMKRGQLLCEGPSCCGELYVEDIGILPSALDGKPFAEAVSGEDYALLPERDESGNKGTFGKLLVIAGSETICGAAFLCAKAALRTGIGMVKIFTSEANRTALAALLPEALITTYRQDTEDLKKLKEDLAWADHVLIGPGIGTDEFSRELMIRFLEWNRLPDVMDADALNLLSANPDLWERIRFDCVITPHAGEMSRLLGVDVPEIKSDPAGTASRFASEHQVTCVLKDAVTVTAGPDGALWINLSGCSALAKAGSGDVLAGMIAGYRTRYGDSDLPLAALAVYEHGIAGETAGENIGYDAVTASELLDYIG